MNVRLKRARELAGYAVQLTKDEGLGTMLARGAVRDVGRAMGLAYPQVDAVAKLIPNELHMTIDKAL